MQECFCENGKPCIAYSSFIEITIGKTQMLSKISKYRKKCMIGKKFDDSVRTAKRTPEKRQRNPDQNTQLRIIKKNTACLSNQI